MASDQIRDNLAALRSRIEGVCRHCGRLPESVFLVAVTKNVEVERIREAIVAGVGCLGENRIQEARGKRQLLGPAAVSWHLVGHLQRNKVKEAVGLFEMIQSVDGLDLAQEISRRAVVVGKRLDVLVEVNTSGEGTKFGLRPADTPQFIRDIAGLPGLRVRGLMTVGPWPTDLEQTRLCFRRLKDLKEGIAARGIAGVDMDFLSMGMSQDFEIALEEGSNMIRIGTAIFGERG